MDIAVISLIALAIAITLSCFAQINVGIMSLVMAWIIGVYVGGIPLGTVLGGFPSSLFLTLAGVTLLFTLAKGNGTLDLVAHRAVKICRGNTGLIPIMFFFLAMFFATIGPGSIASVALLAPTAMAVAGQAGIPAFLMAIMVANGSSAGSLSPFGPTGIIVNGIMAKLGLFDMEWQNFLSVAIAHTTVGFLGYFVFGGLKLFARSSTGEVDVRPSATSSKTAPAIDPNAPKPGEEPFAWQHWLTIAIIVVLIAGVTFFDVNVGMGAFAGAVLLVIVGAGDESKALKSMPWSPILMVSGVTVLVALLEKTGGMEEFSRLLARFSTLDTVTGFTAMVTGIISIFSSTSGVVLPAFLPTIPGMINHLGGGDLVAIAYSMIIGAHLVDVSPLSTTGALCIASAAPGTDMSKLFRWMIIWGFSMSVVAAIGCWLVLGVFWS